MHLFTFLFIAISSTSCAQSMDTLPLRGHLRIVGSTALQPLATEAARLFEKHYPSIHIDVQGGGSFAGLDAVTTQAADIGTSDVYADPASYPDPTLTDHIICITPFVVIVNPDVPVLSLSRQQLVAIFVTRSIKNWQELGGPDLPIVPVIRPVTSGTRATFHKYVLDGQNESGQLVQSDSSLMVRSTVAHTSGAIGYLSLSTLDPSVRPLTIEGQLPSLATIETGRYTFWGYEHMYTLSTNNTQALNVFLNFMLSPQVQQMAEQKGYIPLAQISPPQEKARR